MLSDSVSFDFRKSGFTSSKLTITSNSFVKLLGKSSAFFRRTIILVSGYKVCDKHCSAKSSSKYFIIARLKGRAPYRGSNPSSLKNA